MEIILKEDVPGLGHRNDIISVKDGYGRNYLLPRGFAVKASTRNMKMLSHQQRLIEISQQVQKKEAEELAKQLEAVSCTIAKKTGEEEKLYGSVTSKDIAEALSTEGVTVDRRRIILEEPIKKLGVYTVPIKLHPEVTGNIKVWVVQE